MPRKPTSSDDPAELRRRAEAQLRDRQKASQSKRGEEKSKADALRALHELEVHQIELEIQNAELMQARVELELALEKYTDLYDFAPVAYLTLDHEMIVREANLAGASLLGIERSALVNRRFGPFVSAVDLPAFGAFLQKVFASGVRQTCELTLRVEGRPSFAVEMEAIAFVAGRACRVTLADISERRQAEADRLSLTRLESTGILAAGIAHDFNNLLTVVLLDLELAQSLTPLGKDVTQILEVAKKAALAASGLTQQLVSFANGGAPLRKPTRLSAFIQESVRWALSGSNARSEFSLEEDLWMADVDEGQVGQVIRGIVLNACEAMPQGGLVFVRAENVVLAAHEQASLPAGRYVRVSITDQGPGIAPGVLPKIFDPYFSTKDRGNQKGMGLGLAICHSVIQTHGGAITVETEAGTGTTFHIYLPAVLEISREDKTQAPAVVPPHRRFLVMEHDETLKEVLGRTLRQMGHEVELVEDGQAVVEIYRRAKSSGRPFDAVILDMLAPVGMGAKEVIEALLRINPTVRAVAMSGRVNDLAVIEHERYGFKAILEKPFDHEKLRQILSQVMGS